MSNGHVLMYAYRYVDYRQNNRNRRHCHIVIGLSHEKLLENSWGGLNPSEQWRVRNFLSRRTHRQDGEGLSVALTVCSDRDTIRLVLGMTQDPEDMV